VGGENVGPGVGDPVAAPAQNNVADIAEQPTPGGGCHRRGRTASFAPWMIQGLWLTALTAATAYIRLRSWGMFEVIPYMIAAAFLMSGWLAWSIAWALLARQSLVQRLGQLAAGVTAILVVADWIFEWWQEGEWQLLAALARVAVGFGMLLALMRWRGWRIEWRPGDRPVQFSIGELLLLTAGAAVFMGLMLVRRNFGWQSQSGEIATECVIVACGTVFLIIGLAAKRFAVAALICPLVALAIIAAGIAAVDPEPLARPSEWLLIVVICCPAMAAMLGAIGLARWWGYRLTPT
jgi:hypothetical protein